MISPSSFGWAAQADRKKNYSEAVRAGGWQTDDLRSVRGGGADEDATFDLLRRRQSGLRVFDAQPRGRLLLYSG